MLHNQPDGLEIYVNSVRPSHSLHERCLGKAGALTDDLIQLYLDCCGHISVKGMSRASLEWDHRGRYIMSLKTMLEDLFERHKVSRENPLFEMMQLSWNDASMQEMARVQFMADPKTLPLRPETSTRPTDVP